MFIFIGKVNRKNPDEDAGFAAMSGWSPGGVIAVNALLMGCETDIDWGGWLVFENFLLCPLAAMLAVCRSSFISKSVDIDR